MVWPIKFSNAIAHTVVTVADGDNNFADSQELIRFSWHEAWCEPSATAERLVNITLQVSAVADEPSRHAASPANVLQTKVDAQRDKLAIELS